MEKCVNPKVTTQICLCKVGRTSMGLKINPGLVLIGFWTTGPSVPQNPISANPGFLTFYSLLRAGILDLTCFFIGKTGQIFESITKL